MRVVGECVELYHNCVMRLPYNCLEISKSAHNKEH